MYWLADIASESASSSNVTAILPTAIGEPVTNCINALRPVKNRSTQAISSYNFEIVVIHPKVIFNTPASLA